MGKKCTDETGGNQNTFHSCTLQKKASCVNSSSQSQSGFATVAPFGDIPTLLQQKLVDGKNFPRGAQCETVLFPNQLPDAMIPIGSTKERVQKMIGGFKRFCNVNWVFGSALGAAVSVVGAGEVNSDEAELTNGYFVPEEQSVSLSTLQAPSDFLNWLKSADSHRAIQETSSWGGFAEADVWIFFLRDVNDLLLVPEILSEEFRNHYAPGALVAYRSFTVGALSKSKRKLALAFFMEDLIDRHGEAYSCVAAAIAYSFIFKTQVSEIEQAMDACSI